MFTLHAVAALFCVVIFAGVACGLCRIIDDALPRIARALRIDLEGDD